MALYLVVKVLWVAAALFGHRPDDFGTAGWVALNSVTVVMAVTGVVLGLALARPWGRRLPAVPVVFFSWVGSGFLVPMLPYALLSGVIGAFGGGSGGDGSGSGGSGSGDSSSVPQWETVFLTIGFIGMAAGLAVAVPVYLRERWPRAFAGRVGDGDGRLSPAFAAAGASAVALGLLWTYWALGGTAGLDPAHRDHWDVNGRLLNGSSALWALLGAWSMWALTRGRPAGVRRWVPMTLAFAASGSLFAWSGWKLPMAILRPGGFVTTEYTSVAVAEHLVGIVAGLTLMAAVLRSLPRGDAAGSRPPDV
ncbi:hypothetical protein HUT06_43235 [Actinomadura sp. NAK00032]|nr:hypothetical protein HUT06_43235 [Actinomadura sp. NAK00032]